MRRMRGGSIRILWIFALLLVAGGAFLVNQKWENHKAELAFQQEPVHTDLHFNREISSEKKADTLAFDQNKENDDSESESEPEKLEEAKAPEAKKHQEESKIPEKKPPLEILKSLDSSDLKVCGSIEFRGDGFQGTKVSKAEWQVVLDQFHESKRLLQTWLSEHHQGMPEKTEAFMKIQLERMKIIRPPLIEESDLNWRGIGVWTRDEQGEPLVRMNSGFIKLMNFDAKRTQFEMTRLVAQSWAPCEFAKAGLESPWDSLLKCLDLVEPSACPAGTYSEAGWAVSSVIASNLSPPGCQLPILSHAGKGACFKK
jgi:hypothetical protein